MVRLIVATLIFACLAGGMLALLDSVVVRTSRSASAEEDIEAASEVPTDEARSTTTRTRRSGQQVIRPVVPVPGIPATEAVSLPDPPVPPFNYVLTREADVYSSNSTDGEVLEHLQRGDQVKLGVEILNAEGVWIEVRLGSESFGFLHRENLVLN